MDWEGRDRDRAARRYRGGTVQFGKSPKKTSWLVIVLFWVAASLVTLKIVHYVQGSGMSVLMQKTREKLPDMKSFSTPVLPPDSTVKVDSQQVLRQPIERLASQMVDHTAKQSPSKGSVTIYRCKAYAGGAFWSSAYCGTQQALIDRTATVPGGMPFEQQVQIAEAQRAEAMHLYSQEASPEVQRSNRCQALKRERDTIEGRYTNWQWQPPEVINPDQTRMRGLRAEQARLGCPTQ
ncbi:MAG: hypothetical protein U1D29_03025 [Burkholderiales bacterium]|nr:hypothetical protein [Burkholderiales bacterium]